MNIEPCARLMTRMMPKTNATPTAIRNSISPSCKPLKSCSTKRAKVMTGRPAMRSASATMAGFRRARPPWPRGRRAMAKRRSSFLLAGIAHVLDRGDVLIGETPVNLAHFADVDVLDRVMRFRVEAKRAARRFELHLRHRRGELVLVRGVAVGRLHRLIDDTRRDIAV